MFENCEKSENVEKPKFGAKIYRNFKKGCFVMMTFVISHPHLN